MVPKVAQKKIRRKKVKKDRFESNNNKRFNILDKRP